MPKSHSLGRKSPKLVDILGGGDNDTHYPSLHIDDADDDMMDMPDKGEARIKYHVKERREEADHDGKKRKSLHLHVTHICTPEKAKKKKAFGDDARQSFDNYFKDK
jgi:hypothetical protein